MSGELEDRRILVTGASSGIGAATARACARAGAQVALMARRADALARVAEDVGGVAIPVDLTDEPAARAAVDQAAARLDGLDGVVHSAGVMRVGPMATSASADWRAMLDLNVLALLVVTQAAIPHLRAAGRGDVVTVSSLSGRRVPGAPAAVYSASKFAVHAVSEGLRRELRSDGIRVTVASPGFVRTDLFADTEGPDADRLRARAEDVGLDPEDVARQIVHAIALPPSVAIREIALAGTAQET